VTIDSIKTKAQSLAVENDGLQIEYRKLVEEAQKLQQAIDQQEANNTRVQAFLDDRHGRTDQQLRLEELTQRIKAKDRQTLALERQWRELQRKQSKFGVVSLARPSETDSFSQLRAQLEDENRQEVSLNNELEALKTGNKILVLKKDTAGDDERYQRLKKRRDEFEAAIRNYEARMDELRQSSLVVLSWPAQKKKLVHEMVQLDAHNNKMRDQIKVLREDIDVLRDQVARFERRLDFMQDKKI
jgi:chromosome segregation ATPase